MQFSQFTSMASKQRIDRGAGVIYGVSIITKGEAKTHDLWIDDKTLAGILTFSKENPSGIRVKLAHTNGKESPVFSIVGTLKQVRLDEDKLRADFHLLHSDENFDKILEMAEKQPKDFGLSIAADPDNFTVETIDGKDYLRLNALGSVDLVSDPAANDGGLFSKKEPTTMSKSIKYAKGDSGEHAHDCDCKMCMSKHDDGKDGKMGKMLVAALGLSETATDDEISLALTKRLAKPETDAVLLERLKKLEEADAATLALSQKQQIDVLLSEAAREGKTVPFELAELYTEKDGKLTILETPAKLSKIIAKLPKEQVKLAKGSKPEPKDKDGKSIQIFGLGKRRRGNEAQLQMTREFCERMREQNAPFIGAHIKRQQAEAQTQMN